MAGLQLRSAPVTRVCRTSTKTDQSTRRQGYQYPNHAPIYGRLLRAKRSRSAPTRRSHFQFQLESQERATWAFTEQRGNPKLPIQKSAFCQLPFSSSGGISSDVAWAGPDATFRAAGCSAHPVYARISDLSVETGSVSLSRRRSVRPSSTKELIRRLGIPNRLREVGKKDQ